MQMFIIIRQCNDLMFDPGQFQVKVTSQGQTFILEQFKGLSNILPMTTSVWVTGFSKAYCY